MPPPARKGFGHVVIAEMVGSSLHGHVTLEYARESLRWILDAPTSSVIGEG